MFYSFSTSDKFIIQPNGHDTELIINRISRAVTVEGKPNRCCSSNVERLLEHKIFVAKRLQWNHCLTCISEKRNHYDSRTLRKICGILGLVKLINGYHLVVATYREFVGVINGQVIWRLAGHDFIPFSPSHSHLNEAQVYILAEHCTAFSIFFISIGNDYLFSCHL